MAEQESTFDGREQTAYEVLTEICEASGLDVRPEVRGFQPPYVEIELVGADARVTLGRNGQALDALQYLVNMILRRRTPVAARVLLDADGYRARRAETLTNLARECAAQVRERQEECEMEPLPAHERRIIHNALSDDPTIRTYSEGDEPDRRVIIAPQ